MRKQRYDWETIRAEYEAGSSMGKLSDKYGVDKAAISRRAKKEAWAQDVTGAVDRAIEKNDFDKAKLAKITAETLKIRQEAERKAWGIRDVDAQPDGGALTVRILRVSGE